ncbi:MAG: 2-octaprenyl-6-methoxyphenyl hydroxylase [Rhodanobacteraceae bacterium]
MAKHADILIVGGGLVGASLAIALDAAGIAATLVEAAGPRGPSQPSYDERNLALARASVNALETLGVWQHARATATPITRLHVSRAGEFGAARLSAREAGVEALGATLPARALGDALESRLQTCAQLTRYSPAKLESLRRIDDGWLARIATPDGVREIETGLLVGADGSNSFVRAQLGIAADEHDYAQSLIVCALTPERDPGGCAYERFSDDGPVALLPLSSRRCGLVLTVPADTTDATLALDDDAFIALAQRRFGWRLGRLTRPGKRQAHRAWRIVARTPTAQRAVLIGNAAQTVHPIGAQGFNLGLRDALTMAEVIASSSDHGSSDSLREYAMRRAPDRDGVLAFSHGLVSLACLPQSAFAPLRSLALIGFDRLPPMKRMLVKRGMGFRGAPPTATLERTP